MESETNAGDGGCQIGELAAVERQALDKGGLDDLADRGRGHRDDRRLRGHRHRFSQLRDAQDDLEVGRSRDVHHHRGAFEPGEPGSRARYVLPARRKRVQDIQPAGVGLDFSDETGVHISCGDHRANDAGFLLVDDSSSNGAGRLLRRRRRRAREKCE